MDDNKPAPGDRKARYLAPLIISVVVAAVLVAVVAMQPPRPVATPGPRVTSNPPSSALKAPPPPLTRAELLAHARMVVAGFAATGRLPAETDPLLDRRFSLRIVFGCSGISGGSSGAQTTVTYDSTNETVTLAARPGDWAELPLIQSLPDAANIEAVEGFWFPRPWMDEDVCPAQTGYSAPATPTPPTAPTLGLAQIFRANDSRVSRHAEHPYEFVRKIPVDAPDLLNHSYRLLLEGRITGFDKQQAMQCWVESPDHQPLCLFAVTLDHIAFVDGETGNILANWAN